MIFENKIISAYSAMAYSRCDLTTDIFYFSPDDFPSLTAERRGFLSSLGHDLVGYFYSYPSPIAKRLVIFDHGFGAGHRAYMKEIEMLCRHGYTVFSYDHTGCVESGGENTNGMAQSLCDLNDCLSFITSLEEYSDFDISVMGHSWGGFSTMNIGALHSRISRVVVLSGFVSVTRLVGSHFPGLLKAYRPAIMALEGKTNPVFSRTDGVDSLNKFCGRALLIYSDDDKLCRAKVHFTPLLSAFLGSERIKCVLVKGKGHNPNYTHDAVKYKDSFFADLTRKRKKGQLGSEEAKARFIASYDWHRMTAQDSEVWDTIFSFLDNDKT
jgi:pimeloyl-ACP methyl ester carboxylesterase